MRKTFWEIRYKVQFSRSSVIQHALSIVVAPVAYMVGRLLCWQFSAPIVRSLLAKA